MASMACVLQQRGLSHVTNISKSSFSQHRRPNLKPTKLKLACRAQNGDEEHVQSQKRIARRSVVDGLIVTSAAVGSALAFGGSSSAVIIKGKDSWPELVGEKGEVAAAIIEKENPTVKAQIINERSPVTGDFDPSRVWVFVNDKGIVTSVPIVG